MARLSILKTDRSHNTLQVGQQHYRLLMIENFFDILSLKNWRILRYLKIGYKSLLFTWSYKTFMTKKNYEIDKENMNESCNFTVDDKHENTNQKTKYDNLTW